MKKAIFVFSIMFVGLTTMAQFTYGPKVGLNLANMSGDDVEDNSMLVGFFVGGLANYGISDLFSVQAELLYDTKGTMYETTNANNETEKIANSLGYLSIPILAKATFGSGDIKFFGVLGPQIGFLMSAKFDGESEMTFGNTTIKYKDNFKSTDFGLTFGAGALIPVGGMKMTVDARYTLGLTSIGEEQEITTFDPVTFQTTTETVEMDAKNGVISIGVGLIFGGK
ncbi:MAG: PorT family protein [Bacteroidales bacterium]|nr:PorT family protein [Bacteroidales bacterium]